MLAAEPEPERAHVNDTWKRRIARAPPPSSDPAADNDHRPTISFDTLSSFDLAEGEHHSHSQSSQSCFFIVLYPLSGRHRGAIEGEKRRRQTHPEVNSVRSVTGLYYLCAYFGGCSVILRHVPTRVWAPGLSPDPPSQRCMSVVVQVLVCFVMCDSV